MASTALDPHVLCLNGRGCIRGVTHKDVSGRPICHHFAGIPYAQPPLGDLRWRRPRPLPAGYSYGSEKSPGVFVGRAGVCPQIGLDAESTSEDCLQCDIWLPAGEAPPGGWPVYFYIHGGFLQFGNPNHRDALCLFGNSAQTQKFIIVKPGYRLNVFGFLSSSQFQLESVHDESSSTPNNQNPNAGNFGFWDIRLALEWTHDTIAHFGGNPSNITVAGYSAGAHTAFHQLAFDLWRTNPNARLIRRLVMQSNGPGVQPKSVSESQIQFDELCFRLNVPANLSGDAKLNMLRAKSAKELVDATKRMRLHQFRAVSDGCFVRRDLFASLSDGRFAARLQANAVKILLGENSDEHYIYARHRPVLIESFQAVLARLQADYPRLTCEALLRHYAPNGTLPKQWRSWREAFGHLYALVQVHVTQRGFVEALDRFGAGNLLHRYRIEWRAKCADKTFPKRFGATHGADYHIWWFGDGEELTTEEKRIAKVAFLDQLGRFVNGDNVDWGTKSAKEVRRLRADGEVDIWRDEYMSEMLDAWDVLQTATESRRDLRSML